MRPRRRGAPAAAGTRDPARLQYRDVVPSIDARPRSTVRCPRGSARWALMLGVHGASAPTAGLGPIAWRGTGRLAGAVLPRRAWMRGLVRVAAAPQCGAPTVVLDARI